MYAGESMDDLTGGKAVPRSQRRVLFHSSAPVPPSVPSSSNHPSNQRESKEARKRSLHEGESLEDLTGGKAVPETSRPRRNKACVTDLALPSESAATGLMERTAGRISVFVSNGLDTALGRPRAPAADGQASSRERQVGIEEKRRSMYAGESLEDMGGERARPESARRRLRDFQRQKPMGDLLWGQNSLLATLRKKSLGAGALAVPHGGTIEGGHHLVATGRRRAAQRGADGHLSRPQHQHIAQPGDPGVSDRGTHRASMYEGDRREDMEGEVARPPSRRMQRRAWYI